MYVDPTRIADLEALNKELNRPIDVQPLLRQDIPYHLAYESEVTKKKQIRRNIDKILAQLQDEKLAKLREKLMLAHFYSDKREIWKLTNQIKDYLKEPLIEEGTM